MAQKQFLFGKKNYTLMGIGAIVIALGYVLMSGGASPSPEVFNEEMFSTLRIRVAPLLVIIGFGIEVWAILAKSDK